MPADAVRGDERICFHCGEAIGRRAPERALIAGVERTLCCAGCRSVAQAIAGAGLGAYYERRSAPAHRALDADPREDPDAFDSERFQREALQAGEGAVREVSLLVEGVTCPACLWVVEHRLQSLGGVLETSVDYASLRARVRWDTARTRLSAIVAAVREVGYDLVPIAGAAAEARRRVLQRRALWRLFVAAFGMMQVMMYAIPAYVAGEDMSPDIQGVMRWASLALTVPVVAFSAQPFFAGALRDLSARRLGMDVPIALGIAVAFGASVAATAMGSGETWYDSVVMFVFLLLAARELEAYARRRAGSALDRMARLLPAFATRIALTPHGARFERIAVAALAAGDRVVVAAGETVPADGFVEDGESEIDESLVTGESAPIRKRAGDAVVGGSINVASRIQVRVEKAGADTLVAGIVRLLERAGAEKPALARRVDRIATHFVQAVLAAAFVAGAIWWFIDPGRALPVAVTVLVITCPCALSLATPAALAAATGSLTRLHVLIVRAHALETLARSTHFVFDKTGTLTHGRLALARVEPLRGLSAGACLALAAALEAHTRHPVAAAIAEAAARERATTTVRVESARDVAGEGVEAWVDGRRVRIGRPDFAAAIAATRRSGLPADEAGHDPSVVLGDEGGPIAVFTFSDTPRPEAPALIRALEDSGRTVVLLSGDRAASAARVAGALGIRRVVADAKPADKVAFVRDLQAGGAVVAMVGDGVNDAPVLAQAHVSIAMAGGADLSRARADIVLGAGGLERLRDAIAVARRTERVIAQNLGWATLYNVIAVPAAMLGQVSPLVASVGMAASSALVVANALRAAHPALWRRETDPGDRFVREAAGDRAPGRTGASPATVTPTS